MFSCLVTHVYPYEPPPTPLYSFFFSLYSSFGFVKLNRIRQAANYLDIGPLLDLGCKTIANLVKGKSAEGIRNLFNITNDFTLEEEEQIRRENEWAEDY